MAYECTKFVSRKADKHQGQASSIVLDLGYPRDGTRKVHKAGGVGRSHGKHSSQLHSYEHVLEQYFSSCPTLLKDRVRYGALQII